MSIADVTSIIVAIFTALAALLLIWYTVETRRLRRATQEMLAESKRQNANIEKQNENILLPILFPGEGDRNQREESNFLVIRNVGTGPAFNVEITPVQTTVGVTSVNIAFRLVSNSIVPGESQIMTVEIWINQTLTSANSAFNLWNPLANLDQTFSTDMTIVCDSANGERHCVEFTLTVWPSLRFIFKNRTRFGSELITVPHTT
jgi:hypothetical protein